MPDHAELLRLAEEAQSLGIELDETLRALRLQVAKHVVEGDAITPEEAGPMLVPLNYIHHDYDSLELREAIEGIVTLSMGCDTILAHGWDWFYERAEAALSHA